MRVIVVAVILLALASCSTLRFPGVHRITIQQGNVISQSMIDKLKPGMSKNQVRFVMGNAVLDNKLNDDRWDYIYTAAAPSGDKLNRRLSLYFKDGRLTHFDGHYKPSEDRDPNL